MYTWELLDLNQSMAIQIDIFSVNFFVGTNVDDNLLQGKDIFVHIKILVVP